MRVLLFHPGVSPFVQEAARAYFESDTLDHFQTSFAYRPAKVSGRILRRVLQTTTRNAETELGRRQIRTIPDSLVKSYGWRELIRIASTRLASASTQDRIWEWSELAFDRHVSRNLKGATAVHGYEFASLRTFQRARRLDKQIIYDMPAPGWKKMQAVLRAEYEKFPDLIDSRWRRVDELADSRNQRKQQELDLADIVVANSQFTRDSLLEQGVEASRIVVARYGMPPPLSAPPSPAGKVFRFLYAGNLSVLKGVHYLLEAWRRAAPDPGEAELVLVGSLNLPRDLLLDLPGRVQYRPSIPRPELFRLYQESTLLLFPTLCDGFGQVLTEALSQGLPVLTTPRAGAADFIDPDRNGFIVPAASTAELAERIAWCVRNRDFVENMRPAALKSAATWQWSDFRNSLAAQIQNRLEGKGASPGEC